MHFVMVSPCPESILLDSDRRLQCRIVTQLSQSHHQALRKLAVEVHEGLVTLRGNVRWFYERQLAIQHAQAGGARELIDAVEVAAG